MNIKKVFSILAIPFMLTSCSNKYGINLTEKEYDYLRKLYKEKFFSDSEYDYTEFVIYEEYYYGKYSSNEYGKMYVCNVTAPDSGYPGWMIEFNTRYYHFMFSGVMPRVFYNNEIVKLDEAYENEIIDDNIIDGVFAYYRYHKENK